jgi:hypothetical protein
LWPGFDNNKPSWFWFPHLSRPKSYQMTSTQPSISMLIHTIIFWHVQMILINSCGVDIWLWWWPDDCVRRDTRGSLSC